MPEKPPNSGYSLFSRRMLRTDLNLKQYATKERMMQCSLLWKEMPEEERAGYAREAEAVSVLVFFSNISVRNLNVFIDKFSVEP